MPDSQVNIGKGEALRWLSGIVQAIMVPLLLSANNKIDKLAETSIRQEMYNQETRHAQERTEKRLEYLEQLWRDQRDQKENEKRR